MSSPSRYWLMIVQGLAIAIVSLIGGSQLLADDIDWTAPPEAREESVDAMIDELQARTVQNPKDSTAWRMLGHLQCQAGKWDDARHSLVQALTLDPLSVAAYSDLGHAARGVKEYDLSLQAFARVIQLAPESEYAEDAKGQLEEMEALGVVPVNYEIRTFDGSDLLPLITGPESTPWWQNRRDDLFVRIDLGAQFNDNVTLAPSSRELQTAADHSSAQGNASLTLQWYAVHTPHWRVGPTLDVDYTLNEHQLDRFNLQSYRPGVFTDGTWHWGELKLKPRLAYAFTHDEFNGSTYGNRHNIAASLGTFWTPSHVSTLYYSIDHNNVLNDGVDPFITSQDGIANTLGVVHDMLNLREAAVWRQFRLGADLTNVDATGTNYRFRGVSLYTQGVWMVRPRLSLTVRGGWAFRDYFDYTFTPSRNTNVWRLGGELRKRFDHGFSTALVAQYDRFESQNIRYETDRFLTGGVATWEF